MAWGELKFPEGQVEGDEEEMDQEQKAEKYKTATWELKSDNLTLEAPEEGLISFRHYLNIIYPFKRASNDEELDEQTNTIMKDRNFRLLEFVTNEGKIFNPKYEELREAIKLPQG